MTQAAKPLHKTFEAFLRERRYETGNLPGNLSYKSRFLEKGRMTKLPPSVTLSHQPYRHVDHLEFMNVPEIQDFVRNWQINLHMITQRCGWMYGYYVDDPNYEGGYRAVLEGIYEPPQQCINDMAIPAHHDEFLQTADKVADALGLERIGFIATSLARSKDNLVTAPELLGMAKMQIGAETNAHYTRYTLSKFSTCFVHPNLQAEGAPEMDVFMVSDQLCGMIRDGLIESKAEPQRDPKRIKLRESLPGELQPQVLEAGKAAANDFDPDWFVVKVNSGAPVKPRSFFIHSHFPRENRHGHPQLRTEIKRYLAKCSSAEPSWSRLSDFHLLLFIAQLLDFETAKVLCEHVKERKEVSTELMEIIRDLGEN